MVILKSPDELEMISRASAIVVKVLEAVGNAVGPGVATKELDLLAEELILKEGGKAAFKGYRGYGAALCTSVNEQIIHGIPGSYRLNDGDIVSVDCGVLLDGFYGDAARTFAVGSISDEARLLVKTTEDALERGIGQMVVGNRLYDISWAIQACAEEKGFSVVRDFVGHGIGRGLHEEPAVPNFGKKGTGMRLSSGLVLAIEPMVNAGVSDARLLADGWTAVTRDGRLSAHFEDTVAVTDSGPRILTRKGYNV